MKKLYPMMILVTLLAAFGASTAYAGKTTICHFPPGNPANFHTITVSSNAVNAHVHGGLTTIGSNAIQAIEDGDKSRRVDVDPETGLPVDLHVVVSRG